MSRKLLVVIDVQKDFVEGGALPYGYPLESNTQKVIDFARAWALDGSNEDRRLLFCTKDTHDSNYAKTLEGKKLPVAHCLKFTDGWDFVNDSANVGGLEYWCDEVFLKPTFGTFKIKEAIEQFEKEECETIEEIHIIGYMTEICVLSNAVILRTAFPNKKIIVHEELCGGISERTHKNAIEIMKQLMIEVI